MFKSIIVILGITLITTSTTNATDVPIESEVLCLLLKFLYLMCLHKRKTAYDITRQEQNQIV